MKETTKNYFKIGVPAFLLGAGLSIGMGAAIVYSVTDHPKELMHFLVNYMDVKNNYFRPVSDATLFQGASEGMVAALGDPYSMVLSGEKYDSFMQSALGEYGGIGVVMSVTEEDKPIILTVFPNGTAHEAGLQPGDIITAVDGQDTAELGINGTASAVRGEKGTTVEMDIDRNGEAMHFSVARSEITLPTVQSYMASDDIGYIHIFSFGKHTADEFRDQLASLKITGAKKLIIDVRMNPGGLIDSVVAVADQILTKGTVVSYHTKGGQSEDFTIDGVENPMPMVVLIDKNSASAAEILAGAVQDKKEGTIMGETSYGKGTVQAVLQDGGQSALKISIAQYLTPSGKTIDKVGIEPDIPVEQTGFLFNKDHDNVLQKAVEVLEGK